MATKNCIASLVDAEEKLERIDCLLRVVHEAAQPESPDWVAVVWPMVQDLQAAFRRLSSDLGRSC